MAPKHLAPAESEKSPQSSGYFLMTRTLWPMALEVQTLLHWRVQIHWFLGKMGLESDPAASHRCSKGRLQSKKSRTESKKRKSQVRNPPPNKNWKWKCFRKKFWEKTNRNNILEISLTTLDTKWFKKWTKSARKNVFQGAQICILTYLGGRMPWSHLMFQCWWFVQKSGGENPVEVGSTGFQKHPDFPMWLALGFLNHQKIWIHHSKTIAVVNVGPSRSLRKICHDHCQWPEFHHN